MASYSLLSSYSTVQVPAPSVANPCVYCTIETQPTGIIASIPVDQATFDAGAAGPELTAFADGIETIVGRGNVIAGSGSQTIDPNGYLQDNVSFVVEYTPANSTGTSITAEALVPVGLLSQSDATIQETLLNEAEAIVTAVYNNLENAAGA